MNAYEANKNAKGLLKKVLIGTGVAAAAAAIYMFSGEEGDFHVSLEDIDSLDTVPLDMHDPPTEDADKDLMALSTDPIEDIPADETATITYANAMVSRGYFGYWRGWVMRPNFMYMACGARMRFMPNQLDGDDTAMNGL